MSASEETCVPAFSFAQYPRISYDLPFAEACKRHIEEEYKAKKIYVIISRTLATQTPALQQIQDALGSKIVNVHVGMQPHTLIGECLDITRECHRLDADCIITVGGGTLSDAAKLVAMALGNNVHTLDEMLALPYNDMIPAAHIKPPKFPIICVPTSLSGGEYSTYAGATKDDGMKIQFCPPLEGPRLIILDPDLASHSPSDFWLQSGIRAVDHCVEILCGLEAVVEADAACKRGLQRILPALLRSKANATDREARLLAQLSIADSMTPLKLHVKPGASHGIGHNLGPAGVGHGHTSCILLPAVCKFNASHRSNNARQAVVFDLLWSIPETAALFSARGLLRESCDLGDLLDVYIRALGMPRALSEVNVGRDKLRQIAENSLTDVCVINNPTPLPTAESILEILEMVV